MASLLVVTLPGPPLPKRQTDTNENITFPQLYRRVVAMVWIRVIDGSATGHPIAYILDFELNLWKKHDRLQSF